jgi:uncharacterized small protein (DUF1192 family)
MTTNATMTNEELQERIDLLQTLAKLEEKGDHGKSSNEELEERINLLQTLAKAEEDAA